MASFSVLSLSTDLLVLWWRLVQSPTDYEKPTNLANFTQAVTITQLVDSNCYLYKNTEITGESREFYNFIKVSLKSWTISSSKVVHQKWFPSDELSSTTQRSKCKVDDINC